MMEDTINREDETVADLLSIKSRIEKNITSLQEEREKLKQRLTSIKEQKLAERKKRTEEYIKNFRLRLALADSQKRIEIRQAYMGQLTSIIDNIQASINNQMRLENFAKPISELNTAIEGAISFYSEESLQMELMKRSNAVREKRVEYTRLESEVNDMTRMIEEKRREEERAKLAELEKARQAEERARKLEEEKAIAEEARLREHYHQVSSKPLETAQSFLGGRYLSVSPNFEGFAKPRSSNSSSTINDFETEEGADQSSENQMSTGGKSSIVPDFTFSQLLRW